MPLVEIGAYPWEPNPDVTDIEVWEAYDIPRVGTFMYEGSQYMFLLPFDHLGGEDTWFIGELRACVPEDVEFDSNDALYEYAFRRVAETGHCYVVSANGYKIDGYRRFL